MKRLLFTLATCCVMCACEQKTEMNPFFTEFQTEYGAPDFTKIRLEHYEPAFLKGIEEQNAEIKAIVDNPEEPTFENTIDKDKIGSLKVTKEVQGAGADLNKEFKFTAVINGKTETFVLKHGENKVFKNISLSATS